MTQMIYIPVEMAKDWDALNCSVPCSTWYYPYSVKDYNPKSVQSLLGNDSGLDSNRFWMTFVSNRVKVTEEYVVYDFNGILAAMGGSLGLFLGFSCFDFLLIMQNLLLQRKAERSVVT